MKVGGLLELLEPEVERLGFECLKLEIAGSAKNPILRVYIDKPGGVSIKDCTLVSRSLGLILDEADPFPNRYLLEVSSPGRDRPLVKPAHFERFKGHKARVQVRWADGSKKTHTGIIASCNEETLVLDSEKGSLDLAMESVVKANLVGEDYSIEKKQKRNEK